MRPSRCDQGYDNEQCKQKRGNALTCFTCGPRLWICVTVLLERAECREVAWPARRMELALVRVAWAFGCVLGRRKADRVRVLSRQVSPIFGGTYSRAVTGLAAPLDVKPVYLLRM